MEPIDLGMFVRLVLALSQIEDRSRPLEVSDEGARNLLLRMCVAFQNICTELRFVSSAATLERLAEATENPLFKISDAAPFFNELSGRFADEARGVTVLYLSPKEAGYYESPRREWEEVLARFPGAISDVEEARKCFALGRYAACVYHSTQVVEEGLLQLGEFIHIKDPRSGWTAVAVELAKIVRKKHEDRSEFERANFVFLEQVHGTVEALKMRGGTRSAIRSSDSA